MSINGAKDQSGSLVFHPDCFQEVAGNEYAAALFEMACAKELKEQKQRQRPQRRKPADWWLV